MPLQLITIVTKLLVSWV